MKRGDTQPALVLLLTDASYDPTTGVPLVVPVNLTTATKIRVILAEQGGAIVIDRAPASATAQGLVTMPWLAADTVKVRPILQGEVEVTWPGGFIQTFPSEGYFAVDIEADLG